MEAGATTTMTTKLHILNPWEYGLWLMRIEQYLLMTDYSLWEVIKNGNKVLKRTVGISEETYEPMYSFKPSTVHLLELISRQHTCALSPPPLPHSCSYHPTFPWPYYPSPPQLHPGNPWKSYWTQQTTTNNGGF
nr:hypothetical protein [Tanacetum cinerariifolium]